MKKMTPMGPPPAAAITPMRAMKAPATPSMPAPPQPSPMARKPVHATSRVVPSVKTPRGVVRTDTHNAANQHVPPSSKHQGRGFKGG